VEVWLTVCASSTWATRQPTEFLPPSPPKDLDQYREFDQMLDEGRDYFDLFSMNLYGDAVSTHLDDVCAMMREHGYEKPLVAGES
jgi:hypothetical protein